MSDILVLGATGFTGRLVTRYLANHPQRSSFTLSIAGRSASKLEELKRELKIDDSVRTVQVDVTQAAQVEEVVRAVKVVINIVGPYWRWAEPVIRACAVHGVDYVDLSAEMPMTRAMILKYDYIASKTGAHIVPASGFDTVPADLNVLLANKTLKAAAGAGAGLARTLAVYRIEGGISGGTLDSILTTISIPAAHRDEAMGDYGLSPGIKGIQSPRPPAYFTVPHSRPREYAMEWIMARINIPTVQRSWGLHALASLQPGRAEEAYGPRFTYQESMTLPVPGFLPAVLLNITWYALIASLAYLAPARWLAKKLIPPSGSGPSEEAMEKGFMDVTTYAETDVPGVAVKSVARARGDPGYILSSMLISESALAFLFDADEIPAKKRGGGVHTPSTALGEVLVRRLKDTGRFEFESSIVDADEEAEGRKTR
ncbi:NAD(P)-binding protein [Wolfiporia cocos MD-104 SS10]|uniref:NAD(P)-binding protein n=1 Tax=Wolfiporia cocos (strain MD-104) TaxID=742152 RepID=A0A2H3JD26_WOLCO|nr:NAD(P)-binding protein [Wolfiporia cocos MD-104 SS10]